MTSLAGAATRRRARVAVGRALAADREALIAAGEVSELAVGSGWEAELRGDIELDRARAHAIEADAAAVVLDLDHEAIAADPAA